MLKKVLLLLMLTSLPIAAIQTKSIDNASVALISPTPYEVVTKGKILFKGKTSQIKKIEINGKEVPIKKGRFYIKLDLTNQGEYHKFEIKATTKSGKKITFKRKIFWLDKHLQEKDIIEKISLIETAYLELGWTLLSLNNNFIYKINRDFPEESKRFSLPEGANPIYIEKQSQFMLNRSLVLYKNQEMVIVIPWSTRLTHLTLFSQYFVKSLFKNGVFNINSVTIVFYNKDMNILELYYSSLGKIPSPKWVLNDKELKQPHEEKNKEKINEFITQHFIAY